MAEAGASKCISLLHRAFSITPFCLTAVSEQFGKLITDGECCGNSKGGEREGDIVGIILLKRRGSRGRRKDVLGGWEGSLMARMLVIHI